MINQFYFLFIIFLMLPSQYTYSGGMGQGGMGQGMGQGQPGKYVQGLHPVTPAGQRGQHPIPYGPGGHMDNEFHEEARERNEKSRKNGGGYGGAPGAGGYVDCEMYDQNTCQTMHFQTCYWDQMEIECERIKPGQGGMHGGNVHGGGAYPQRGGNRNGGAHGNGQMNSGYNSAGGAPYGAQGGRNGAQGYGAAGQGYGAQGQQYGAGGGAYGGNQGYPPANNYGGGAQGGQSNYGGRPYLQKIMSQSKPQIFHPKQTKTYIEEHIMYNPWFWTFIFNCVVITFGITLYGLRTQNKFQIDQLLRYQEAA